VRSALQEVIDQYEKEYLKKILGSSLYEALIEGLKPPHPDAKWTNLKNQIVDHTLKISAIANYCFFFWLKLKTQDSSGIGVVGSETIDNQKIVSPVEKMVENWNESVKLAKSVWSYLDSNYETYPELKWDEVEEIKFINRFGL
jgi:hypothetical protein